VNPLPDRAAYAVRQAQLLDALLRGGDFPPGFVAAQADAAGRALRRKRGRAVAHAWPALALSLRDTYEARFDAFDRGGGADAHGSGDPLREGLAFARSLAADGLPLGDDVRVEILLARAALHRRGAWIGAARLRHPHPRLLVVARLPVAGLVRRSVRLCLGGVLRPGRSSGGPSAD